MPYKTKKEYSEIEWKTVVLPKIVAGVKRWRNNNRKKCRILSRLNYWRHRDKRIAQSSRYGALNKEKRAAYMKAWRSKNRIHIRAYDKARLETNLQAMLKNRLHNRIASVLKRRSLHKTNTTIHLIGTSLNGLRAHLESLFVPGMSWENRSEWHIDHHVPCKSFNLADVNEQRRCFHYSNLRPLWATDNMKKSSKLNYVT